MGRSCNPRAEVARRADSCLFCLPHQLQRRCSTPASVSVGPDGCTVGIVSSSSCMNGCHA